MKFWSWLQQAVTGRGLADRSERRRLERQYKEVEEYLKTITEITREVHPSNLSKTGSNKSDSESSFSIVPSKQYIPENPKPSYLRSNPEVNPNLPKKSASVINYDSLLAAENQDNKFKRNNSENTLWNSNKFALPPMPEMKGIGRYRMYVGADEEFQMNTVRRSLIGFGPALIEELGDFEDAELDPKVWQKYRAESSKSSSFTSGASSASATHYGIVEDRIDSRTGTRISRGFSSSTNTSTTNSMKDRMSSARKESSDSQTSQSSGPDGTPFTKLARPEIIT